MASAVEARDRPLDAAVQRGLEGLKTIVDVRDLLRIDPDRLRTSTEELVLRLQNAAPLLDLRKPALEADAR